jgi:hypothetical protein
MADRDSYIFRRGVTPNTLSVISSKNRIFAVNSLGSNVQIGVIATFDPSEARTIEPIRGIGFGDKIAELVPGVTDPMTISVTRTALYLSNIYQAFGFLSGIDGIVRSLRHHRWPFDIRQEIVFSQLAEGKSSDKKGSPGFIDASKGGIGIDFRDGEGAQALVTYYEGCWISDYSVSYAADTALVQETVTINVSDIYSDIADVMNTSGEMSVLAAGEPGVSARLSTTVIEAPASGAPEAAVAPGIVAG